MANYTNFKYISYSHVDEIIYIYFKLFKYSLHPKVSALLEFW